MALFDVGHKLPLPNRFWLRKDDENQWQVGGPMAGMPDVYWAMILRGTVPVSEGGGSMDWQMKQFSDALMGNTAAEPPL